jgi:hypothetical protein
MPKPTLARVRAMSRAQKILVSVYGWLLLAGWIWYTVAAIHYGWKHAVIHALTFMGAARVADLILVPLMKRATIRRLKRTAREMRLLRDEHRKDPAAEQKLTAAIHQIDQAVAKAKTL